MPPPGNNQDELNIGIGLVGFENIEETLQKLEVILNRARKNMDTIFKNPVGDAEKFSEKILGLEKRVVSLTSGFAGIGKAGTKGFEDLNKIQLEAFNRLTELQKKLQSIDTTLSKDVKPSTIAKRVAEAKELSAEIDILERKLLAARPLDIIQKTYAGKRPAGLDPGTVIAQGPFSPLLRGDDPLTKQFLNDKKRFEASRAKSERDYTTLVEKETEKQYRAREGALHRAIIALKKAVTTMRQEEAKLTEKQSGGRSVLEAGFSKLGLGGLGGGLGPFAAIVAVGFAIQRAYSVAEQAIERASEQARANRTLASSAAEAGISIDFLTKKNKEFAQLTALSDVKATTTVAKITQLATLAQTPQNIDKLIKGFANLGAARGLDATGIETVVQQIITGQDEGYKKLLLPNPAQLQAKYARENNRSVGSLTAVEKAQIFQAEFLKKADLFNGAAEARLQSVDGRAAKLNASFENLANTLSTKFANNYDVATTIDAITKAFGDLNSEVDDLASKAERGINIDKLIQGEAAPGILAYISAGARVLASGGASLAQGLIQTTTGGASVALGYNQAAKDARENAEKALADVNPDLGEDYVRQRINSERLIRSQNERVENQRKVELAGDTAKEQQQRFKDLEDKRLTNVFKEPSSNASAVLKAIDDIKRYSGPLKTVVDEAKVLEEARKRFAERDIGTDKGFTPQQVFDKTYNQVRAEQQAAVDQKNLPLFSEEDKRKQLLEGERVLEELAKKAHELVKEVRESLVGALADKTDNPFVKLLHDASVAAEDTEKKFARLGPALAKQLGAIAEKNAKDKLAIAEYESSDRELRFRQQAKRLEALPDTQTNAFERRLQRVETEISYQLSQGDTARGIVESQFFGQTHATGKARKLREAFLRSQYGSHYQDLIAGARGTREEKDAYREIGVRIKESQKDVDRARSISTQGLGTYARGAIAEQLLGRLPTTEELLPRLRGQGRGRAEAQGLFRTRQDLLRDKQEADDKKFKDFIENQKFIDLNRKDAEERAKNLFDKGTALPEKAKLDKFLDITNELGTAELTPELRKQRIKALTARADIEAKEKETAKAQLETIDKFVKSLTTQVENGGLIVKLAETPIVDVNISASGVSAALTNRPSEQR
jgi:hypothetical protein